MIFVLKQGYQTRKSWLSEGMKNSIKTKNKLYRQCEKTGNVEHDSVYKLYRNNLNILLIELKQKEAIMRHFSVKIKTILKILAYFKTGAKQKEKNTTSCSKFLVNQEITKDKTNIANGFNRYFVNIGPTLAGKMPQNNKYPTTYMENRVLESMVIAPVAENEVQSIIKSLKESTAGWDVISAWVAKATYSSFITPLTQS